MSYTSYQKDTPQWLPVNGGRQETSARTSTDILVVDDEQPIAHMLADILREEGYGVRVAYDGASALLEILTRPPALVLLDVAMPVMLGSDLLRYLRSHGYNEMPVIVMTAGLYPMKYLSQGATAVLPKPFDVGLLLEKVDTCLAQGSERELGATDSSA